MDESFLNKAICKNCIYYIKGECQIKEDEKIKGKKLSVGENENCACWDEKIFNDEQDQLKSVYNNIIEVLKKYCDLKEEYYSIIAIWIIGTYFHKQFPTYPYLFFNAMKGSGKTRLMKLILHLAKDGNLMNNMSESVLFRTASQRTIGIDEFENIGSKEKSLLRELLNSAYKKGTVVERAKKSYSEDGDKWEIERYDIYCPLLIANITGMDEVLGDRCISLIIDKSSKKNITRLLELFDIDPMIQEIKRMFSVVKCSVVTDGNVQRMMKWNEFIYNQQDTTLTTPPPQTTLHDTKYTKFFEAIFNSNLDSRLLELFFPLFVLAESISEETFRKTLETAEEFVKRKKDDDFYESRDISLIGFVNDSQLMLENISHDNFIKEKDILGYFRIYIEYEDKNKDWEWLTDRWLGRALKRLNLVEKKKRMARGIFVKLDFNLAKSKARMFKSEEQHIIQEKVT